MSDLASFSGWTLTPTNPDTKTNIPNSPYYRLPSPNMETPAPINENESHSPSLSISVLPVPFPIETPKVSKTGNSSLLDTPEPKKTKSPTTPGKLSPIQQKLYNEFRKKAIQLTPSPNKNPINVENEFHQTSTVEEEEIPEVDLSSALEGDKVNMNPNRMFDFSKCENDYTDFHAFSPRISRLSGNLTFLNDTFQPIQNSIPEVHEEEPNFENIPSVTSPRETSPRLKRIPRIYSEENEIDEIPLPIRKKKMKLHEPKDILSSIEAPKPKRKHPKLRIEPLTRIEITVQNRPHRYEILNGRITINENGRIWTASKGDSLMFNVGSNLVLENDTNEVTELVHI
ncbi:hypothetical protein GPJ56_008267 [Histomonas meleagridis]|uniref:uncharacterized protein n=1 Tax=Histomonas meleagridis TaxID=135588 RepID=UPI00355A5485|nr:hypothetical protein GPJ56_008267 [Histomonas meleagridis]KAH0806836.1 hypothetical protein GO595_000012 [Histomonas meleagridis]